MPAPFADAHAIRNSTAPAVATVVRRAIRLAEAKLVLVGGAFTLLDLTTTMSACCAPGAAGFLSLARMTALGLLFLAVLCALIIRRGDRSDTELLKALAVVVAVVVICVATRTSAIVPTCSM